MSVKNKKRKTIPHFGSWFSGIGAKDNAIDKGEKKSHELFLACDVYLQDYKKTTKVYRSFKNATMFLKKANKHPLTLNGCGIYEVIRKGKECRLYADLEWPLTDQMTVSFVQETIIDLIAEVLGKERSEIQKVSKFTNACEGTKGSLHLVIPTIKFKDTASQQLFWNEICEKMHLSRYKNLWFLDQTEKSYIRKTFVDFSVYNADRQIRMLNAGKMRISDGKCVRPLLACDSEGIVMSSKDSLSLLIKEKLKYFITYLNGREELIDTNTFGVKEVILTKREIWNKTLVEVVVRERLPGVEVRSVDGRKVLLNTIKQNWCPLCGDCTGQHNAWLQLKGRKMLLRCFAAKQQNNQRLIYSMDRHASTKEVSTSKTLLDVLEECSGDYDKLLRKFKAEGAEEMKGLSGKDLQLKENEIKEKAYQEWQLSAINAINQVCVTISGESTSYVLYKDFPRDVEDHRVSSGKAAIYNERAYSKLLEPPFIKFKVGKEPILRMWCNHPNSISYSYTDCVCEHPTSGPPIRLGESTFNSFIGLAISQDEAILKVHMLEKLNSNSNSSSSSSSSNSNSNSSSNSSSSSPSSSSSSSSSSANSNFLCPEVELKNFQEFLKRAWCQDDPVVYDYVVKWLAHQIQRPGQPLKVSLVLMGNEGCGKGSVIQVIGKILGTRHFYQPRSQNDVLGNFNYLLQNSFLVFMDEMFWGGDKANRGNLIKLISEETMTIERKYSAQKVCMKRFNIIFASNEKHVIPATSKSRRFCVLEVSDMLLGLSKFERSRIWDIDPHIVAKWLYAVELGDWNGQDYPKTEALTQQKLLAMPPVHKWWMDYLSFTDIPARKNMVLRHLYDDFVASKHCPQPHTPSFQAWWAEVKDVLLGNPRVFRKGRDKIASIEMLGREELIARFHAHYDGAQLIPNIPIREEDESDDVDDIDDDPFEERKMV